MSKDEINRLLAEKVMGWTEESGRLRVANACVYAAPSGDFSDDVFDYGGDTFIWNPHDSIAQAMMVVEKILSYGNFALTVTFNNSWTVLLEHISGSFCCETKCSRLSQCICDAIANGLSEKSVYHVLIDQP